MKRHSILDDRPTKVRNLPEPPGFRADWAPGVVPDIVGDRFPLMTLGASPTETSLGIDIGIRKARSTMFLGDGSQVCQVSASFLVTQEPWHPALRSGRLVLIIHFLRTAGMAVLRCQPGTSKPLRPDEVPPKGGLFMSRQPLRNPESLPLETPADWFQLFPKRKPFTSGPDEGDSGTMCPLPCQSTRWFYVLGLQGVKPDDGTALQDGGVG